MVATVKLLPLWRVAHRNHSFFLISKVRHGDPGLGSLGAFVYLATRENATAGIDAWICRRHGF